MAVGPEEPVGNRFQTETRERGDFRVRIAAAESVVPPIVTLERVNGRVASRVFLAVELKGNADLALVAQALNYVCLLSDTSQRRQQHSRQDRDDRDNHEQLE
jgi:hypothetical protein